MCWYRLLHETSDTLGNDTESSTQAYGNCWERSSSPFRDHADRALGRPRFLHMQCLLACRVKFIHIARFLYDLTHGTKRPILAFLVCYEDTWSPVPQRMALNSLFLCQRASKSRRALP